ncbi:MAG: glycosyltransferase family 4 protein [Acidobacteriota bacterium]
MSSRSLKIGYVMQADSVPMDVVTGPQLHVKGVIRNLRARGHQVRTLAIQHGRIQWSDDLVNWHPGNFGLSEARAFRAVESVLRGIQSRLRLPFLRIFDSLRFSDACVDALADCDILYERCGIISYGGLIASRRLGIPIVLELNGDLLNEYHDLGIQLSRAQWFFINQITRLMYRRADRIVPVSEVLRQRMIARWRLDPAKVVAVENGTDVERFVCPGNLNGVRSRYGIGDGSIVILVSTFEPWHGIDLILEAFALLAAAHAQARLVLVGDGRLRAAMEEKAVELGITHRVTFTGRVEQSEVAALLGIADVAAVCQRGTEAEAALSPLKLFEYMAAGKGIVAAAGPGIRRLITDGQTGLIVPPGNTTELARALAQLLENDRLRAVLGQAARQRAIEKYSWARTAQELEAVLQDALIN